MAKGLDKFVRRVFFMTVRRSFSLDPLLSKRISLDSQERDITRSAVLHDIVADHYHRHRYGCQCAPKRALSPEWGLVVGLALLAFAGGFLVGRGA